MKVQRRPSPLHITIVVILLMAATPVANLVSTPLDDYIKLPDRHYKYELLKQIHADKYTVHILNMTSQKWLNDEYSNKPIWWHHVCIIIPKTIKVNDTAFLWASMGHNTDKFPKLKDNYMEMPTLMAVNTNTISVLVRQIPNQPIVFKKDPEQILRSEDDLLAWTWREFLQNTDRPNTHAILPMTKAVVRTMDTVEDYVKKTRGQHVKKFFVAGASKRGWVTWLTAAVDTRIIGIAPVVFDMLHMKEALHYHFRSLKGWSFAFEPYYRVNITHLLDSDGFRKMCSFVDPIVYKDRYKIPTYMIKATGDEFFLLDETRFFYNELPQRHYVRVLRNVEHFLIGAVSNVFKDIRSFYLHLLHGATYPQVSWVMESKNTWGSITLTVDREPLSVTAYHARTLMDGRRDFRLLKRSSKGNQLFHPVLWFKGKVTKLNRFKYKTTAHSSFKVWKAFYIEVSFQGMDDSTLEFTTGVNIIPNTYPSPDCTLKNCTGTLV